MVDHSGYMARALELAHQAAAVGEVPVGAVVVDSTGTIVGEGHNRTISESDPTAHAEVVALRAAAKMQGNYRLNDCTLYVTLEPCPMCMGAIFHSRIRALFFGATDPKGGACGSVVGLDTDKRLNPHCVVHGGVLADACSDVLRSYFRDLRVHHAFQRRRVREDALRMPSDSLLAKYVPGAEGLVVDDLSSAQGLRVHVWAKGQRTDSEPPARLLLCLHSIGQWAWQFADLLREDLPADVMLMCVDLPGHGQSDKSKSGWEFDQSYQLNVLGEILDRFATSPVVLLACRSACSLAMELAHRRAESVLQVVLADPMIDVADDLGDAQGRIPRSLGQLLRALAFLRGDNQLPEAIQAQYPDVGYAKGLLRWLGQRHETGQSSGAQCHAGSDSKGSSSLRVTVIIEGLQPSPANTDFLARWSIKQCTVMQAAQRSVPWAEVLFRDHLPRIQMH
ncbi:tRNA adenosine(34) deaminase TadA [Curvibacter sp. APW13]|uniref:tRNA adenosine(34) deaminase TadA n=1 Tax=Curvibacter sp. APW13 TaxID=3077236 RepID=UPI0028DF0D76|nr:tRNA adenosine(34) deaminase TadA [Curvibacter sp. APW13]MDT8991645.1 tRNA adenosine(34) deaminase TadA [Curvibacter sp. APW13]